MNFLENSYSSMSLEKGELDALRVMGLESAVMWHTCFFYSLFYELIKILDTDEFLDFPSRMIMSIFHSGMRITRSVVGLLRWNGGGYFATPPTLRPLAA